jgi:hypothetical protein
MMLTSKLHIIMIYIMEWWSIHVLYGPHLGDKSCPLVRHAFCISTVTDSDH